MNFPNPYLPNRAKVSLLQRWIIVHSIMYYELGESIVEDRMFDMNSVQLVKMMYELDASVLRKTKYWYAMYEFDGSTGFDLYDKLNDEDRVYLMQIAEYLLRQAKAKR